MLVALTDVSNVHLGRDADDGAVRTRAAHRRHQMGSYRPHLASGG